MSDKADALVEKAVLELHGEPGIMTGYVVCAAVAGLDGVTRYVVGAAQGQQVHVSVGLNIVASSQIDGILDGYVNTLEED